MRNGAKRLSVTRDRQEKDEVRDSSASVPPITVNSYQYEERVTLGRYEDGSLMGEHHVMAHLPLEILYNAADVGFALLQEALRN